MTVADKIRKQIVEHEFKHDKDRLMLEHICAYCRLGLIKGLEEALEIIEEGAMEPK